MSFEKEWAGLVTNARSQQSASMHLNGADGHGGGDRSGGPSAGRTLQVTPHVLRSYAGRADKVSDEFQKTDNETMRETGQVPGSMKGFASDEAFKDFQETWRAQMKYLDGLYTGVAKALRAAATTFKAEDVRRKADLDRIAPTPSNPLLPKYPPQPNSPLLPNTNGTYPLIPGSQSPYLTPQGPQIDEPTS